jgi:hypothetical protein
VVGETLTFNVLLDGDVSQLKQALALDSKLIPIKAVPEIERRPSRRIVPEGYSQDLERNPESTLDPESKLNRVDAAGNTKTDSQPVDALSVGPDQDQATPGSSQEVSSSNTNSDMTLLGPSLNYQWIGK